VGLWDDLDELKKLYRTALRLARHARWWRLPDAVREAEQAARQIAERVHELSGFHPEHLGGTEELILDEADVAPDVERVQTEADLLPRLREMTRQIQEFAVRRTVVDTLSTAQLSVLDRCPRCTEPVTGPDEPVDEQGRHWHRRCQQKLGDLL
jgi:hypothetical protein